MILLDNLVNECNLTVVDSSSRIRVCVSVVKVWVGTTFDFSRLRSKDIVSKLSLNLSGMFQALELQ